MPRARRLRSAFDSRGRQQISLHPQLIEMRDAEHRRVRIQAHVVITLEGSFRRHAFIVSLVVFNGDIWPQLMQHLPDTTQGAQHRKLDL